MLVAKFISAMRSARILIILTAIFIVYPFSAIGAIDDEINSPVLKKASESLRAHRSAEALRTLSGYVPGSTFDQLSLGQYHFLYAEALDSSGKPGDAIEHLRLAYLYFPKGQMKELSLVKRGEVYLKMDFFYEAISDISFFIQNFPSSEYLQRAHLGLARGLSGTRRLREAIGHYDYAGKTAESEFGKAVTLQKLGLTGEAQKTFQSGLTMAPTFVRGSEETMYYLGENLRQTGRNDEAKKYLQFIKTSPFKDKAGVSMGQIAMTESKSEQAVNYFASALRSGDRQTRSKALLNLAEVSIKTGDFVVARKRLQEVRLNYPYCAEYDEATLKLAAMLSSEGDFHTSVNQLKELIFRRKPLKDALDQLESVFRSAKDKKDVDMLTELWRSAGSWLLDESRETFLMEMASALRKSGKEFLVISQWLLSNGSAGARNRCLIARADFYAGIGEPVRAREYLKKVKGGGSQDEIKSIEARIHYLEKDFKSAAETVMSMKRIDNEDLKVLSDTLTSARDIQKAATIFEKAVQQAGGSTEYYIRLADLCFESGKKAEALRYYRLVLARDAENEWAIFRVAALSADNVAQELLPKVGIKEKGMRASANARMKELNIEKKIAENFL